MTVNNPFSQGMSVRVSGETGGAQRALGGLQNSMMSTRKLALGLGAVLAGALAVKGLQVAVSAASDFEDAMVEVQKVTDEATADELGGRMRELSKDIPVAAEELAGLAADAARFGVRGPENIEEFTTTVAKMATATDLSTEEAGEAFARLATLTDTPVDQMENFGSAVNELGNNFATSSGEIVDSMLRGSAALSQFGLNQTEIAGMSAALNEVSESSQRAGTRLRRVAQELMDPGKTEDIAAALGMSVEEFETMREEDPSGVIEQMAEAFAEGGDTADALRETLSTASRQAVAGLAQNLDGLRDAMETSSRSFEEGTSLQEEFDAATQTFSARMQVLRNNLNDLAITVGNQLLPALNEFVASLNELLSSGGKAQAMLKEHTAAWAVVEQAVASATVVFDAWRAHVEEAFRRVRAIWERHGAALMGEGGEIQQTLTALREFWAEWGDEITTVFSFVTDVMLGVFSTSLDALFTLVRFWMNIIQGDFGEAISVVADFWARTLTGLLEFVDKWTGGFVSTFVTGVLDALNIAGDHIEEFVSGIPGFGDFTIGTVQAPAALRQFDRGSLTRSRQRMAEQRIGQQQVDLSINVEGDDELARLIRENSEVVVERENRNVRRRKGRPSGV